MKRVLYTLAVPCAIGRVYWLAGFPFERGTTLAGWVAFTLYIMVGVWSIFSPEP